MNALTINIQVFDFSFEPLQQTRPGDAAFDMRSTIDVTIPSGGRALIPCGFAIEIPEGFCGLVLPRSGLAIRHGVGVLNAPGLIDPNYRGEVSVILINGDPDETFEIHRGDRIAQLLIVETPTVTLNSVPSLTETNRGAAGFGSSGLA